MHIIQAKFNKRKTQLRASKPLLKFEFCERSRASYLLNEKEMFILRNILFWYSFLFT